MSAPKEAAGGFPQRRQPLLPAAASWGPAVVPQAGGSVCCGSGRGGRPAPRGWELRLANVCSEVVRSLLKIQANYLFIYLF